MGEMSAERVARNDATFREANEQIEAVAESIEVEESVPFLCECADMSCTAVISLALSEYEEIRSDPTHFLNVPGHDVAAGPHGKVVAEREGYVIVQKIGLAGDIVTELDERTSEEEKQSA